MLTDLTFHPEWWAARGFRFDRRFFTDWRYRIACDQAMRRVLFEEFGDLGLGEKDPLPRPLIDSDLLAGEFVQAQVLGCDVQFPDQSLPFTPPLNLTDEQVIALKPVELSENAVWNEYDQQFRQIYAEYGRVESYMDMHGVQNLAIDLRGQTLFEDYYIEPDLASHVLDIACRTILDIASAVSKYTPSTSIGVTSIVRKVDPTLFVTSNCTCEMVSEAVYDEFLLERDRRLQQRFAPFGIHHCGQTMEHLARSYARLSPDFIEVGAHSNITETLKHFSKFTKVNLRYHPADLAAKSPQQIRVDIAEMKRQSQTHPYVSISSVGVDASASHASIAAFIEAVTQDQ